jgi:RNA polymerase sigma-70 factor (ECF subfamily)
LNIIIQGCINQDRKHQQAFYKLFYGYSAAICLRYTSKKEEVSEVVNDGFLKIFKEIQTFRIPNENYIATLKAWIRRIMINTSIDHYRKYNKNEPKIIEADKQLEIQKFDYETPIDKLSYDEVVKLVQELSPMYKMVFNMYVIDGLNHEEISKQLNISVGTSKSNLSKARFNIMKLIKNNYKAIV